MTNCKGMYTWEGRESKSVIDYALINTQLYNRFKEMVIDEEKELIDLTDHNLLLVKLKKTSATKKKAVEQTEYYRKDEKSLQGFAQEADKECMKVENMEMNEEFIHYNWRL